MAEITHKPVEQKVAEADVEGFQEALGPFVVAAETTRMPMVFTNAKVLDLKALAQVESAFEGTTDHGSEIRYRRKDGSMFWAAIFISPVLDESGVVQHFASFVDLTSHGSTGRANGRGQTGETRWIPGSPWDRRRFAEPARQSWQEKNGPPVTPPTRKGFGSRVIERGLAHELEGTVNLDYQASGVVCTINFPAPPGARDG